MPRSIPVFVATSMVGLASLVALVFLYPSTGILKYLW